MKGLNIPDRFTGTVYVAIWSDPNFCLYGDLYVTDVKPSEISSITLGSVDVDIPLSADGSLNTQVEQLRSAKQKIIDEATEKAGQIDEAIESLLAIEYKEPEA